MRRTTLLLAALVGCDRASTEDPTKDPTEGDYEELRSDLARDLDPEVSEEAAAALVEGNSTFAADLYQRFREEKAGESFFFSPISVSVALAMTWGGARGDTESQMADALSFELGQSELHPAMNDLDLQLAARPDEGVDQEIAPALALANSLWGQQGYPFLDSFLDLIAESYGAGMQIVDFAADPSGCTDTINAWVEDHTNGLIEDLIPPGAISEATLLVLVNAIYFKGAWNVPFDEDNTRTAPFARLDGSVVDVDMMAVTDGFSFAEGDGWQAVEMPFDGEQLGMVVIVPEEGRFEEVEGAVDGVFLADLDAALAPALVSVELPRFTNESSFLLKDSLMALGMVDAFTSGLADFNGIAETGELFISAVLHKAFISVDEAGVEAAAATAVVMGGGSAEPDYQEVHADRPFIYAIRDLPTGTVLFLGRELDPSN